MSLQEPARRCPSPMKMKTFISILDTPDVIMRKFRRAITDSETQVRYDEETRARDKQPHEHMQLSPERPLRKLSRSLMAKDTVIFKRHRKLLEALNLFSSDIMIDEE